MSIDRCILTLKIVRLEATNLIVLQKERDRKLHKHGRGFAEKSCLESVPVCISLPLSDYTDTRKLTSVKLLVKHPVEAGQSLLAHIPTA